MMKSDIKKIPIRNNTAYFVAIGEQGRIQIEGSGDMTMEVSVDGVHFATVGHNVTFNEGVAIAPFEFCKGDIIRLSAATLTKVLINYN